MGILASIFGRAFGAAPLAGHIDREDGFVDVTLPIAEHKWAKDGSLTVIARGSINGQAVSLAVELGRDWKPKQIEGAPITVYWGNGHILSVGPESDAFLSLLAREYKLPAPGNMATRVPITMAGLATDPSQLRDVPAKIKIFFESGGEDHYGEVFINIDLVGKTLEFRDKDPEYHNGIVSSLAAGA